MCTAKDFDAALGLHPDGTYFFTLNLLQRGDGSGLENVHSTFKQIWRRLPDAKKERGGTAREYKMTRGLILVVLCALLVACDARKNTAVVGAVYNNELANAFQQPEIFNKKRTPLEFESGASAQNCGDYLRLIAGAAVKEEVNNQIAKGEYLLCEALALIGDKKLAPAQGNVAFGEALATRLDLRSFPSSLFQRLDEKKHSLAQLDTKLKIEPAAVTYETQDWRYRLEVAATLDVNNNGTADWVLWLADEAKSENYRQYQTLVVYDVGNAGPLRAIPYAVKMNAQRK